MKKRALRWTMVLVLPLALGCESGSFKPEPPTEPLELLWKLELNHHAVMLSTAPQFDTLRLVATPRNYRGEPLSGFPAAQFVSKDPAKIVVTSDGILVARAPVSEPVWVVATMVTANMKRKDSVRVKVMAINPPPVLASFSVHPLPPDSAKIAVTGYDAGGGFNDGGVADTLRPRAADLAGVPLDTLGGGIPVHFSVSDPTIAQVNGNINNSSTSFVPGRIMGFKPGVVTVYASTTVFGVTKADTLPYRIGYPVNAVVIVGDGGPLSVSPTPGSFSHPEWTVGVGAHVRWLHGAVMRPPASTDLIFGVGLFPLELPFTFKVDVTFDEASLANVASAEGGVGSSDRQVIRLCTGVDPGEPFGFPSPGLLHIADCTAGGNFVLGGGTYIPDTPPYPLVYAIRWFKVPGTYEYRSTMHGTRGRITVVDEH